MYMSRSYKKFPCVIQEKEDYRLANRRLRHDKLAEIPKGGAYKKVYSDCGTWKSIWTKEQAVQDYKSRPWISNRYSLSDWINYWERCAYRK
jgi:hypothetical protein